MGLADDPLRQGFTLGPPSEAFTRQDFIFALIRLYSILRFYLSHSSLIDSPLRAAKRLLNSFPRKLKFFDLCFAAVQTRGWIKYAPW